LELGTGEALISFLDEKGAPEVVEMATILPPQSKMGAIDDLTRNKIINMSALAGKYDEAEDPESASEIIMQRTETKVAEAQAEKEALLAEKARKEAEEAEAKAEKERAKLEEKERVAARKAAERAEKERAAAERERARRTTPARTTKSSSKTLADRFLGNVVGSIGSAAGRKITNKILKDLFK
jgi:membrane protein involved in colicin uptake